MEPKADGAVIVSPTLSGMTLIDVQTDWLTKPALTNNVFFFSI